ncbi:MAG: hypothetical protein JNK85_22020 [Verrucomicrobiales bacterium]|nr:hypothetical protein [Verrucomicrobiales bacterium]
MSLPAYPDAALLLVAHGSSRNAGSAVPAFQHGDALRRRGVFAEVTEAFCQQEPSLSGVLRRVFSPTVFIVPLFISDGWFTETVVPTELGLRAPGSATFSRVQVRGNQTLVYCRAVGSHPAMSEVLIARALAAVQARPFPRPPAEADLALLIAGHGTAYSAGSRRSIEEQVRKISGLGRFAEVHGVFLEEDPRVSEAWNLISARNAVLVPFFISDGLHTQEDIPAMLGESPEVVHRRLVAGQSTWRNPTERNGRRLWCGGAVGTEPLMAEVILQRVSEGAVEAGLAAGQHPAF